jgi:hypothetical protein
VSKSGITVLSLLLERVIEHACQDTWRNVRDDLKRVPSWRTPGGRARGRGASNNYSAV